MPEKKRVAVIGAGASGLPALRHALAYGVDVVCFEGSGDIGGLWRYKPEETDESSVMKTTVINTSKEMCAYSDFPPLPEMANFMHNTEMLKYLRLYAEHYDLLKHIKFHHKVSSTDRAPDFEKTGKWTVKYVDASGNHQEETFDGVLLCSGHHQTPYMPEPFEGQERFQGNILHSHSYKDHKGYEDKTVVVVGVGNSGGDVAVELSRIAKQVYLVTRRGTWIFNRVWDYGTPFDLVLNRRFDDRLKHIVPEWLSNKYVQDKLNARFDHERYGLKPKHKVLSAHPTVNDELPARIASGTVKVRPNIRRFTENGVEFLDGQKVDHIDAVVMCTGYSFEFKLVEGGKLIPVKDNEVDLFKYTFPAETSHHNTLAVIGLVQPLGAIMPMSEMQARVFFENLVGTHKLPSRAEMLRDIREKKEAMAHRYVKSRRHTIQVDYVPYMDELASLIDAVPKFGELIKEDPMLALKVEFGPALPYIYRLRGPHAWKGAKSAIMGCDERVFKATNSGEYHKTCHCTLTRYFVAAIVALIALFLIF